MHTPADTADHTRILKGLLLAFSHGMVFSLLSVLVKIVSTSHNSVEITFWRSAIMILPMLGWLAWTKKTKLILKANIPSQVTRSTLGTVTMFLIFSTYSLLPLAEAQSLFFTAPLFVVVLSWPLLKEKVGPWRIGATLAGFGGVLLMLQPGAIHSTLGAIMGLLAACGQSTVAMCLRVLGRTEDPDVTVFYFSLIGIVLLLPLMPMVWTTPTPHNFMILIAIGLLAMLNQLLLTQAHFLVTPSLIAPITYLNLFWALLFDFWIWDKTPTALTLWGAAIIIAANALILYRERLHARKTK